jgi:hypothetical protein
LAPFYPVFDTPMTWDGEFGLAQWFSANEEMGLIVTDLE